MNYPSTLLQRAVGEMSRLPGIGQKTALRLVLHLLRQERSRDKSTVCVVENVQDVMAIENTQQYTGVYHVLGGIISPMEGIGPSDLTIESLVERVSQGGISEVILALSPTMEGDTTNFYIYRKLQDFPVQISVIARGIAQNDELQYTDEVTLGRALAGRIPFKV